MKKQLKLILLFSFSLVIFSFYSCSENNVTETENTQITFSCFAYSFNDALKIDFCVVGNCCPDSQRFISDYNISSDTIFVSVADTAANLCYCICNYTIHVELLGLTKDKYLFVCDYPSDYANLNYLERVSK
jgi:hypothetical protein